MQLVQMREKVCDILGTDAFPIFQFSGQHIHSSCQRSSRGKISMCSNIGQRVTNTLKIAVLHFSHKISDGLLPGVLGPRMLQNARLMKLVHKIVQISGKLFRGIRQDSGGILLRLLGGKVDAAFLANFSKMLINGGDQPTHGLGDGFQAGFQFRQRTVLTPTGNIADRIAGSVDAVILTHGKGYALGLHFHGVFVLRLGRLLIRIPGSGGKPVLFLIVEDRMGDLMDGGANRLYLAHALPDSDTLRSPAEKAVHAVLNGFDLNGDRGRAPQGLHERLILLHITGQISNKTGERLAVRLVSGKDLDRLEQRDFNGLFLNNSVAVLVQHRGLGIRVQLHFLDLLFERCGGNDGQPLFSLLHMTAKLLPLLKARYRGDGVGPLHMNEDGIVDGIAVKPGHGAEIIKIPLTLEKFLDVLLYPVNDFFDTFPVGGFLVCHSEKLLSNK